MQRKFNLDPVVMLPKVRTATTTPESKHSRTVALPC